MKERKYMEDMHLVITNQCNINCKYCYNKNLYNETKEMKKDLFHYIIDLAKDNGVKNIFLTGGEPTLHMSLEDMINYCSKKGLNVSITTNGKVLDEKRILDLEKVGLNGIAFSLDSLSNEGHNHVRLGSNYKDVWEKVLYTKNKTNMNVNIICVINKNNIKKIEKLIVEATKNGVSIVFQPLFEETKIDSLIKYLSNSEWERLKHILQIWGKYSGEEYTNKMLNYLETGDYSCEKCINYSKTLVVDYDGKVKICFMGTPILGNIMDEDILEKYKDFLHKLKKKCPFASRKCLPMEFGWYDE